MTDEKKLAELETEAAAQDERARQRDLEREGPVRLARLRARLLALGVDVPVSARGNWHEDGRVWWVVDDVAYADHGGRVYVEHHVGDVYEWSLLGDDGQPIKWQREPPPWSSLN
jgi:hypothetical protein